MTIRWQQILAQGFTNAKSLLAYRGLDEQSGDETAEKDFPVRVPRAFADRMAYGDADDPLLRQVLAVTDETHAVAGFVRDPLSEKNYNTVPGVIHKYPGRMLLTLAGACAINCRYCFRRHFPYADNALSMANLHKAVDYIQQDNSIDEIILSGGDPLLIADTKLDKILTLLESIEHVGTIRFHSRIPIVLPERMTADLIQRLQGSRCQIVLVVHVNHPNELSSTLIQPMHSLRQAGVHLLNQSVLLHKINDDVATLTNLSRRLFAMGILPYYLHTLDKVAGAAHFNVDIETARQLHQAIQRQLPGYLVPRLVTEIAGQKHKVWVNDY